jgi:hypothetical protein
MASMLMAAVNSSCILLYLLLECMEQFILQFPMPQIFGVVLGLQSHNSSRADSQNGSSRLYLIRLDWRPAPNNLHLRTSTVC